MGRVYQHICPGLYHLCHHLASIPFYTAGHRGEHELFRTYYAVHLASGSSVLVCLGENQMGRSELDHHGFHRCYILESTAATYADDRTRAGRDPKYWS